MCKFALHLSAQGRALYATYAACAAPEDIRVETLPDGDITDYRWHDGMLLRDPLPRPAEPESGPDPASDTDAMLIDHEFRLTLLELGL